MRQKCYLTLATGCVWLISYELRLPHRSSDVGQIFLTASLHMVHLLLYALVCEKEISHMGKNKVIGYILRQYQYNQIPDYVQRYFY